MKTMNNLAVCRRLAAAALLVASVSSSASAGDRALAPVPVRLLVGASGRMEVSNETLDQRARRLSSHPDLPLPRDPFALGRQYTSWFYAGETDRIWQLLSPGLKQLLASAEGLRKFRDKVIQQAGYETRLLDEHAQPTGSGAVVYERIANFSAAPSPWLVQWVVANDGTVTAFVVQPSRRQAQPQTAQTSALADR